MDCTPEALRARIYAMRDEQYAKFSAKLLPDTDAPVGVRLPQLRALAREIAASPQAVRYLDTPPGTLFEEKLLYGMTIGYTPLPLGQALGYCAGFVPLIDSWSVCDSACATMRFAKAAANREPVLGFLRPYCTSEQEYPARFGLVMLLFHFSAEPYTAQVLQAAQALRAQGYYAKMAAAWAVCECFVKSRERTLALLESRALDPAVQNSAIRKIRESRRVSEADKAALLRLRCPA